MHFYLKQFIFEAFDLQALSNLARLIPYFAAGRAAFAIALSLVPPCVLQMLISTNL